jgi:hypothetical protein
VHPRIAELLDYAEAQRAVLLEAVAAVPEPLRDRRPDPGVWSVAEVLEHLHLTERGIAWLIGWHAGEARVAGTPMEQETGSLLGSLDAFRIPERIVPVASPGIVRPRGTMTAAQAIPALAESRRALVAAAEAGDGLALGTITYAHAVLGALSMYQWMLFVGQHEARHAAQIREIGRRLA